MRNSTSLAHVGVLLDLPDGVLDVSEELDYDEDGGEGQDGVLDNLRILRVLGDGSIQHQAAKHSNILIHILFIFFIFSIKIVKIYSQNYPCFWEILESLNVAIHYLIKF